MALDKDQFSYLRDFINKESGIFIPDEKEYLLDTRLMPIIRKHQWAGMSDLVQALKMDNHAISREVIEAMTTNETYFFRDNRPFDLFKNVALPRIKEQNSDGKLRIWSAACSSGQEPYSLAMILKENPQFWQGLSLEIIATDIDLAVLDKAKEGMYSQFEVQRGLPIQLLMKYFKQLEEYGDRWQISDEIKQMVQFKQVNLLDSFAVLGTFDFVFCRNVLIYFEPHVKRQILEKVRTQMKPHGLLMMGTSEAASAICPGKYQLHDNQHGLFEPA